MHTKTVLLLVLSQLHITSVQSTYAHAQEPQAAWYGSVWFFGKKLASMLPAFASEQLQRARNHLHHHPYQVGITIACAALLTCIVRARLLANRLQSESAWGSWSIGQAVGQELATSDTRELLQAIQLRYIEVKSLTNFMRPIERFMEDTAFEIAQLHEYYLQAGFLKSVGLGVCIDQDLYTISMQRRARLETMRELCRQWLSVIQMHTVY